MIPPRDIAGGRWFVVLDFSGWLVEAFYLGGVSGMVPMVVGWLAALLSPPAPALLAVALDSAGPTWRHKRTARFERQLQYKGQRETRPREFYAQSDRLVELVTLHRIPLLYAEGWEADDAIATAARLAATEPRLEDTTLAILTKDKDLGQLAGDRVVLWDGDGRVRGAAEIEADKKHPVPPSQLRDLLAIVGDSSDNVSGVEGLGPVSAARILRRFGDLRTALAATPLDLGALALRVEEIDRQRAKAAREATSPRKSDTERAAAASRRRLLDADRVTAADDLALYKDLAELQKAREAALLSRELVSLDYDAPIGWCPDDLPVGGWDVPGLKRVYGELGFTALAREVRSWPKPRLGGGTEHD